MDYFFSRIQTQLALILYLQKVINEPKYLPFKNAWIPRCGSLEPDTIQYEASADPKH
jgi:hypothetical protein